MKNKKYIISVSILLIALLSLAFRYYDYIIHPWTRNGQVHANIIQVTPRVSGPIVRILVKENQFVNAGDVLFEIDPRTYQVALDKAKANLNNTGNSVNALEQQIRVAKAEVYVAKAEVNSAEASIEEIKAEIPKFKFEFERQEKALKKGATSKHDYDASKSNYEVIQQQLREAEIDLLQAKVNVEKAKAKLDEEIASLGKSGQENALFRAALASVEEAELNLEFTKVTAPVDGYITNLNLRLGSHTVTNQPALALIDISSYWVYGFFRENNIENIQKDNSAVVTLMSHDDTPIKGYVESIGWGISQTDGSTGHNLLPSIAPTFEWIRLAQRIPIRIKLLDLPENIKLRVGQTASVLVKTDQQVSDDHENVVSAPIFLR